MKYYALTLVLFTWAPALCMQKLADQKSLLDRFKNNEKFYSFIQENDIATKLGSKTVMPIDVHFIVDVAALKHNVINPTITEISRKETDSISEIILHDAVAVSFTKPAKL